MAMFCCGVCRPGEPCNCEICACGHCIHGHEKMRWHRVCGACTPLLYRDQWPNEIDNRDVWTGGPPYPDYGAELDKHRPAGQPPLTCCAEHSEKIRRMNEKAAKS